MPFQVLERNRGFPRLSIREQQGGRFVLRINLAAVRMMGKDDGDTVNIMIAWDADTDRVGIVFRDSFDDERQVRRRKIRNWGIELRIDSEVERYRIPVKDLVGTYSLFFDDSSGFWVADCGRGINRNAVRNRLKLARNNLAS